MRLPIKQLWQLGLPLSLGLVIQMIIVMVDSAFAGNISYVALAAVSLAGGVWYVLFLFMIGFAIGASVRAGQAIGSDDEAGMINCFRQGMLLCVVCGIVLATGLLFVSPVMHALGQDPEVIALTEVYLRWVTWTLPLQGIMVLVRDYFAVINTPWKSVLPIFLTLILNAFLDYCLSTGELGFPALGLEGISIASLVSNIFMVVLLLRSVGWQRTKALFSFINPEIWRDRGLRTLFVVSLPIVATLVMEEVFFSGSIFIVGILGAAEQAAHQMLFNLIGISFLFNTGIGIACSIVIGKHIGAKNYGAVLPTVKATWILTILFTVPFALIALFLGDQWIALYLDPAIIVNVPTIEHVKSVLLLVCLMLIVDTIWLVAIEALHGILDTTYPAICTFIAYWLIGGPMALWSAQHFENGFVWVWISMAVGVIVLTVLVVARLRFKLKELSAMQMQQQSAER